MRENCQNCQFYMAPPPSAENPEPAFGYCRRFPPSLVLLPGQPIGASAYPSVQQNFWCGEHIFNSQPAPQAQPEN